MGASALNHILDTAQVNCNVIRSSPVPATSKVIVATASTVAKLRYKGALSSLDVDDLYKVDKTFSVLYRDTSRNLPGFPTTHSISQRDMEV